MTTLQGLLSKVGIDLSDVTPGIAQANALIGQGITEATTQGQAGLNQLRGSFDVLSATEQQAEQQAIRTAQAQARAMAAEGDRAGAVRVLSQAQSQARGVSEQTSFQIQAQIANLERGTTAAEQYGQALSSSMTSALGPIAVVTTAISAATATVTSFADAFKFDAQLEATTKSIDVQLKGVRDSATVWAQATAYGDEYKLTQQQINEAIVASMPVIRQSHASMEEILSDFDRLKIRSPEKTFQDAARALGELQAGQVVSIEHLFNVPANDANRMKQEIAGGADAVQVLNQYLTDSGIGMDALRANTEGAMGALKDYAKAQEELTIAQGKFAEGPGIAFLNAWSTVIRGTTRLLGGDGGLAESIDQIGAEWQGSLAYGEAYNQVMIAGGAAAEARASGQRAYNQAASDALKAGQGGGGGGTWGDPAVIASATQAEADRVDITRLSAAEQEKLAKALEDTGNRASDAYAKIGTAQTDYEEKGIAAAAAHSEKLADLASTNANRLTSIDRSASDARVNATEDWRDRVTRTTEDGHRRLIALETSYEEDLASKRATAADRSQKIDADLAQKVQDDRAGSARKLLEIEQQIGETHANAAQAASDRGLAAQEQAASRAEAYQQRLADAEAQLLQQRATRQQQYQDRVADLAQKALDLAQSQQDAAAERQAAYQERLADMQEQAAERAADRAQSRQDAAEDRAQRHADKLAELQAKAAGTGAVGHVTTLTGGRFTTEATGGGADTSAAIAAEEARYQQAEAQAARDEQRQQERDARALARALEQADKQRAQQEQKAQEQAATQAAALIQQQAQLDRDYAAQEQKALLAAERQRALLDRQYAQQEQAAAKAQASAVATQAQQDARQIAQLEASIARERASQAQKESDATAAAERAHAELIKTTNADLADRQAGYEAARVKAQDATALQIADENTAYAKRLVQIAAQRQEQIATQAQAYAEQQAKENEAYQRQEDARAVAYAKQKTQLESALGEQLLAYTKAQEDIGQITHTAAADQEAFLAAHYGRVAASQKAAFDQFFGTQATDAAGARRDQIGDIKDAGLLGPGGVGGSAINIAPGAIVVSGVSDPAAAAAAVRDQFIQQVRAAGGNVSAFFGGSP